MVGVPCCGVEVRGRAGVPSPATAHLEARTWAIHITHPWYPTQLD